jgi:hypothetical protein
MVETTTRWPLPWKLVIADRNRGDFRFIRGQPFSTRYRNFHPHVIIQPYFARQHQTTATPPHLNIAGLILNLYY